MVEGDIGSLSLPPLAAPEQRDELWRHTCFEAFVRAGEGGYHEFNFAPSQQWAAYRFDAYRSGLTTLVGVEAPHIQPHADGAAYLLNVSLDLSRVQELQASPWRLGVSAVIEDTDGRISYWALAHPPGKPDFHHPDSFVLELPPPSPA